MPTYDLVCNKCGFEDELFSLSIVDTIEHVCPTCQVKLAKKPSAVHAIFKGRGFYATEYGCSKGNFYTSSKKEIEDRDQFIEEARKGPSSDSATKTPEKS